MSDGIPIHVDDVPAQRWEAGEIQASRKRLGAAANALRMGVAILEIDPGARSTPAHAHVDEDEDIEAKTFDIRGRHTGHSRWG